MEHHFNVDVAREVGVNAATILNHIIWWCQKNAANGRGIHDGRVWTYNTAKAMSEIFPYLTENQVRTATKKLVDAGLVVTGDYSENRYARPIYYSPTEKALRICGATIPDFDDPVIGENETRDEDSPNTLYRTDIDTDTDTDKEAVGRKRKRFTPPTLQECRVYAREKCKDVDADRFFDYYSEGGWHDAKGNPVRNWKQKMLTWSRHESPSRERATEKEPDLVRLPYGMLPPSMVKTDEEIDAMMEFQRIAYYGNAKTYQRRWEESHAV